MDSVVVQLRDVLSFPKTERKEEFFHRLKDEGLMEQRRTVMSHREFLTNQFLYISGGFWMLTVIILLFIIGICYRYPGNHAFALTPLLAMGIWIETRRSVRWKMAELECAARFSLRSVVLARLFLVGIVDAAGLLITIFLVCPVLPYSLLRTFLYMIVPFLTASLAGSVYERRNTKGRGWESIGICLLSSVLFAVLPVMAGGLYDERWTALWAVLLIILAVCFPVSIQRWKNEMEEPVWN